MVADNTEDRILAGNMVHNWKTGVLDRDGWSQDRPFPLYTHSAMTPTVLEEPEDCAARALRTDHRRFNERIAHSGGP